MTLDILAPAVAEEAPRRLSLRERIRAEFDFDPRADDRRVAERVLRSITKADLLPLLVDEVAYVRRAMVRHHERRTIGRLARAVGVVKSGSKRGATITATQRRVALNNMYSRLYGLRMQTLDLGDGHSVRWGLLTVEQARTRLAMLRRQVGGIQTTIMQLEQVIVCLEQTGASCLDELAVGAD
jgi:hypothetical protein